MKWIDGENTGALLSRHLGSEKAAQQRVADIIQNVRQHGDAAIRTLTHELDGVLPESLLVRQSMIDEALDMVPPEVLESIRKAARNIREFHEQQRVSSWEKTFSHGVKLGQKVTPMDSVGLYVPGGTAAYPSSVLMAGIPAQVAGVKRIVLVSPPQKDGRISAGVLAAANEIGISEIVQAGGAQAIAALAYGTESIQPVDKIVGPGNIYVTLAKKAVYGDVAIDSLAGPSEIVILADETAHAGWIAADLLSQAEHDPLAMAVLITSSQELGRRVEQEIERQLKDLPRKAIASEALEHFGAIILVDTIEEGVRLVNHVAPEHLEIVVAEEEKVLEGVHHAGAIFLGAYSSEPAGDYIAGPNHIIPTNGTARFSSPLSVDSFLKKSSVIRYTREAILKNGEAIMTLARYEGLEAHARAIEKRLQEEPYDN